MKKKLKRFFTLSRRHDGFTLVELIVVIAIMAILAGVGSVGYAGYIKSSNKGADKTLVGNVIRAVETGTYSTMFASNESFQKGMTSFPVGVIVLSAENGCEVASTSSTLESSTTECKAKTITNYVPVGGYTVKKGNLVTPDVYTVPATQSIEFCETHSNVLEKTVYTKYSMFGKKEQKTFVFAEDCVGMYALITDHNYEGGSVTSENIVKDDSATVRVSVDNDSPIKDALKAAFGDDLSALTLKYDGWGTLEDGGHTYGTLMTYTGTIVADIKEMADLLTGVQDLAGLAGYDVSSLLSKDYENSADMLDTFANAMQTNYADEAALRAEWTNAADQPVNYNMGMNTTMDLIYGVRIGYNTAFASYCQANNADPQYLEVIKDYKNKDTAIGIIDIPVLVNNAAFNGDPNDEQSLYQAFAAVGGDNEATKAAFNDYKELYEEYLQSEAYLKNSDAFYQTLGTVAATGQEAYKNGGNDEYFAYYSNMLEEASAYYELINEYNGNGILILVTVENGIVKCDVSPSSANPRND